VVINGGYWWLLMVIDGWCAVIDGYCWLLMVIGGYWITPQW